MNGVDICQKIFETIFTMLKRDDLKNEHSMPNAFVRKRNLSFEKMILYLLNSSKKAMSINIADMIERHSEITFPDVSKQAVSKARQKIRPEVFAEFVRISVAQCYANHRVLRTWNGYHVYAIDGSTLQIPQTERNLSVFGSAINQSDSSCALARASTCFDVLNDLVMDANISDYGKGEQELAVMHLNQLEGYGFQQKSLFLFDRGYPSYALYRKLQEQEVFFLMRTNSRTHATAEDGALFPYKPKEYGESAPIITLRKVHVTLDNGTVETLVTNIHSPDITAEMFKELYFLRWGIECKYKEFKDRLEIEEFTGSHPISIEQDFYISVFKSNISAIVKSEADYLIQQERATKNNKYEYQANRSFIINRIQEYITKLICGLCNVTKTLNNLILSATRNLSQIQPNRSYSRKKRLTRREHHNNRKSCL